MWTLAFSALSFVFRLGTWIGSLFNSRDRLVREAERGKAAEAAAKDIITATKERQNVEDNVRNLSDRDKRERLRRWDRPSG
jgi:hypothetical protein